VHRGVVPLVLLALVAMGGRKRSRPGPGPSPVPHPPRPPGPGPAGAQVPIFLSAGTLDAKGWASSRWRACVTALDQYPELVGRNVSDIATSVVAHWGIETAWGDNEFNYNLGGIHASGSVPWFKSSDAGVPTRFEAWDSLDAGVHGYLDLIRNHFSDCWSMLIAQPPLPWAQWYDCLGAHGYYGVRGAYEYARQHVEQLLGD
jgi:hypothetical protein